MEKLAELSLLMAIDVPFPVIAEVVVIMAIGPPGLFVVGPAGFVVAPPSWGIRDRVPSPIGIPSADRGRCGSRFFWANGGVMSGSMFPTVFAPVFGAVTLKMPLFVAAETHVSFHVRGKTPLSGSAYDGGDDVGVGWATRVGCRSRSTVLRSLAVLRKLDDTGRGVTILGGGGA